MLWVVTVAWLYIKPFRNVSSKEPTGDPVDSDPDVLAAEAALPEPTVWSQKGFATPVKLWPFSPILPVLEKYIFTLLNGAIEKFCDLKGIFLVGQVPLFLKNFLKIACTFALHVEKKEKAKKNIFFTRCGLSSTYHLVPLTLLQYDTKPTRQYDSIMLIHDSSDTEVFSLTSAL